MQPDPVVFILADQSFPACFPAGGAGHCLNIIRLEDGSLADLCSILLETISDYIVPAGSVVMLHSLSHLNWVGVAAYTEEFVRARQRILGLYRTGLSVLHGLPILADGCTDPSMANDLLSVTKWYSLVSNPADRDIQLTRSSWTGIFKDPAVQSSTTATSHNSTSSGQPLALPTLQCSKPLALPASDTSTASPLVNVGLELLSASSPIPGPSSTSSTLLNCPPSVQGSICFKLRLPTSLDSLKPTVFQARWIPGLQLTPTCEAGEREIISSLLNELNAKFDVNLDTNFSTNRDVAGDLDDSGTDSPSDSFIVVGSSHAFRLAGALNSLGETVNCLATPFWKLVNDSIETTSKNLEEAVRCNPKPPSSSSCSTAESTLLALRRGSSPSRSAAKTAASTYPASWS